MVRMFLQFSQPDLDCQLLFFQSVPMVVDSHIVMETTFTSISAAISPKQFYFTPNITQWKYLKSVGVAGELNGEDQGNKEAKTKTGVQCLMTFSVSGVS